MSAHSMPTLVVLNPAARQWTARRRWRQLAGAVLGRTTVTVVETDRGRRWRDAVSWALAHGTRKFVAAGGDGTVGALAHALAMQRGDIPLSELVLGAIGLGSSNDFHKPIRRSTLGVPLRLDESAASLRDLGRAQWIDLEGNRHERIFVVSSSVGVVAAANRLFNEAAGLLRWLKARWVGGAIVCAACRTIAGHRNLRAAVMSAGVSRVCDLTSLSVLKTPHLSGFFTYDTPIDPASGLFGVNLAEGLSRRGLLALAVSLARGRFAGRPHTRHWAAPTVEVAADQPFALELDGETSCARRVRFEILPDQVRVCS